MKRSLKLKAKSNEELARKRLIETDLDILRQLEERFLKDSELNTERESLREIIRQSIGG